MGDAKKRMMCTVDFEDESLRMLVKKRQRRTCRLAIPVLAVPVEKGCGGKVRGREGVCLDFVQKVKKGTTNPVCLARPLCLASAKNTTRTLSCLSSGTRNIRSVCSSNVQVDTYTFSFIHSSPSPCSPSRYPRTQTQPTGHKRPRHHCRLSTSGA